MRRRRASTVLDYAISGAICLILAASLFPVFARARDNAQRSACQSNLKQIGLALQHYAADNGEALPRSNWVAPLISYTKIESVFRCPARGNTWGSGDYFFNARFLGKKLGDISVPQTLILAGDRDSDSPMKRLPPSWLKDEYSPAWRHLGKANYLFADGHVKWLKAERVNRDFRMVAR